MSDDVNIEVHTFPVREDVQEALAVLDEKKAIMVAEFRREHGDAAANRLVETGRELTERVHSAALFGVPSEADIQRGQELAKEHGWNDEAA